MTLFIVRPKRQYEISDVYILAAIFIVMHLLTRIIKRVIKKMEEELEARRYEEIKLKKNQNKKIRKKLKKIPRGGKSIGLTFTNDDELSNTIQSCIKDEEYYLIKDPELKKLIFRLVRGKIKNESLQFSPNLIRLVARKIITQDTNLLIQVGNTALFADNRERFITRVAGTAIAAIVTTIVNFTSYGVLLAIMLFLGTDECGYRCEDYFENLHVSKDGIVKVFEKSSEGHIIIGNFEPETGPEIFIETSKKQVITEDKNLDQRIRVETDYKKARKKARLVTFDEFRKKDPILSTFPDDVNEPVVPRKETCLPLRVREYVEDPGFEL